MGRDSSVSIATRQGLDELGIESRWGRDFPQLSKPTLGPTQPPIQWALGLFTGGKAAGAWQSSRKSRAISLLTLLAFMACYRANFTFIFFVNISQIITRLRSENSPLAVDKTCVRLEVLSSVNSSGM